MKTIIKNNLEENIKIINNLISNDLDKIVEIAKMIIKIYQKKGKLFICGNGGSAADAQHIAAEMINHFKIKRKALPAIALTTDTSILTSIGNDLNFNEIFSRQIEALSSKKDILIAISTSGNSQNILNAVKEAQTIGMKTIGLTGKNGGKLSSMVDINVNIPSNNTAHIQEMHITILHNICELVEKFIES
ncbi:MAG: D-sedoheptulose 7-phosphate isomerase [bacterium]